MTNMDKLYEAVEARGPVCVGLDTDFSYLPADFVDSTLSKGENIVRFNKKLIDAIRSGVVDAIATDNAPHSEEDKLKGMAGMVGSETAFGVCYTKLCNRRVCRWRCWCT